MAYISLEQSLLGVETDNSSLSYYFSVFFFRWARGYPEENFYQVDKLTPNQGNTCLLLVKVDTSCDEFCTDVPAWFSYDNQLTMINLLYVDHHHFKIDYAGLHIHAFILPKQFRFKSYLSGSKQNLLHFIVVLPWICILVLFFVLLFISMRRQKLQICLEIFVMVRVC
mgnify:CR=1 FL=1